ncbi:hypothetical protein BIY23_00070 [Wolbachia pipientis]|uniref:Uncharacterized protein n=1 Tax=Wolbachia pipientis TaxID=955 RepID=A0A1E7QKM8_WOLPI|nr:ankyrin repeat domain-containing protein [Wolbachia pipientis]OEY86896.1 hypothetical protein BIY23_00070 [Wolbachia pipientis]
MFENSSKYTSNIELHSAVKKNNSERISELIKNGCDINVKDPDSSDNTALHIASATGNLPIVKLLIKEGKADINVQNNYKDTPLILAIQNKHFDVAQHLVKKDADINAANQYGNTPISYAIRGMEHAIRSIELKDKVYISDYSNIIKHMLGKQVTENKFDFFADIGTVMCCDNEHVSYYIYQDWNLTDKQYQGITYDNFSCPTMHRNVQDSLKKSNLTTLEQDKIIALAINENGTVKKAYLCNEYGKPRTQDEQEVINSLVNKQPLYIFSNRSVDSTAENDVVSNGDDAPPDNNTVQSSTDDSTSSNDGIIIGIVCAFVGLISFLLFWWHDSEHNYQETTTGVESHNLSFSTDLENQHSHNDISLM